MSTIKIRPHEEIVNPKSARKKRTLVLIFTPLIILLLLAVSTMIQVDDVVAAKGYVLSSEQGELRALHTSVLQTISATNQAVVEKGQDVITLKPAAAINDDVAERIQDELVVLAPISGTLILNDAVAEGQNVAAGQLLGEVFGKQRIVKLHIRERYNNRLAVDLPVTVDIQGKSYTGAITSISPTLESEDRYVYRVITCSIDSDDIAIGTSCIGFIVRGKTSLLKRLIRY